VTKPLVLHVFHLGIMLAALPVFAADLLLSPRLQIQGGYENNRLQEPGNGTGSACWGGSSGLDLLLLGESEEASLSFDYGRTHYEKEGFDYKHDGLFLAQGRVLRGRNDFGANLAAGFYKDEALPEDDAVFQQADPFFIHSLENVSAEWVLKGSYRRTAYDISAYTSTPDRVDSLFAFRPEWRWRLSRRTSLWAEILVERNTSDAPEADYTGFGGTLGGDIRPSARLTLGSWVACENRSYDEDVDGKAHRETPLRLGGWGAYRLRPWLELFASANWESVSCSDDDDDYTSWSATVGMRVTLEYALDSFSNPRQADWSR
jgi:hypothetical protein